MAHKFFENKIPHNGYTYTEYSAEFQNTVNNSKEEGLNDEEKSLFNYKKLNLQRSSRIDKTFKPSEEIKETALKITKPQIWMMITETWCGDSAQNIPYIAKIAALNPLINFRIILRDENTDIMDLYLTNGTRSIPMLTAFDEDGNELFKWGPRPKEAADLVKNAKAEGLTKDQFIEKLHLWYGRNRGAAIESELAELIKQTLL